MSDLLTRMPTYYEPLKREKTRGLIDEDYEIIAGVYEKSIEWAKAMSEMCNAEVLENGNIRMHEPEYSCFSGSWEIDRKERKIIPRN
jgi:hypothetical protein